MEHTAGRPAPYGKACLNCARAKCKCILRDDGDLCERCFRLKKQCTPSSTIRKRRQRSSNSQTARLEQKLDGLVSLLKSSNRSSAFPENAPSNSSSGWEYGEENHQASPPRLPTTFVPKGNNKVHGASPLTPASSASTSFPYSLPPDAEISAEEAEQYLHTFRTQHLRFFPFIWLVEGKTSRELRQESPYLWLCIMSISSRVLSQQVALVRIVREIASREIVMEGERTIDLVQGLLCIVGWGHHQITCGPLVTVFSHLCIALLNDLDLLRTPHKDVIKSTSCPPPNVHPFRVPDTRTMQHRRTALSCYLITKGFSSAQHRIDGLSWSPYLEECLKLLEQAKEAPHDEILVHWVKIQHVTTKATEVLSRVRDAEREESTRIIAPYISSLGQQLSFVRQQIPAYLRTYHILELAASYAEFTINELVLTRVQLTSLTADLGYDTMDCLLAFIQAAQSWLRVFAKYEPMDYMGMSFVVWKQFSSVVFTVGQLAALEDPAWDPNLVKRMIDLPGTVEHLGKNIEYLVEVSEWRSDTQENVFMRCVKMMSVMKSWVQSVYQPTSGALEPEAVQHQAPLSMAEVGQQVAAVAADAAATAAASQPLHMSGGLIHPAFDINFWSDDIFGLWDMYSGRTFAFTE